MNDQKALKGFEGLDIVRKADFSPCGKFRYTLIREWDDALPRVVFVLLNPSTADANNDDPTNRRCMGFAIKWGFGSLVFVNLFSIRSPDPTLLKRVPDPIGPSNDSYILKETKKGDMVVCGWGNHGAYLSRDIDVLKLLPRPLHYLKLTLTGNPQHPLYLLASLKPTKWHV